MQVSSLDNTEQLPPAVQTGCFLQWSPRGGLSLLVVGDPLHHGFTRDMLELLGTKLHVGRGGAREPKSGASCGGKLHAADSDPRCGWATCPVARDPRPAAGQGVPRLCRRFFGSS